MVKMSASSALTSTVPFKKCSRHCFTTSVSVSSLQQTVKLLALRSSSTNFEISSVLLLPLERNFSFVGYGMFSLLISFRYKTVFADADEYDLL